MVVSNQTVLGDHCFSDFTDVLLLEGPWFLFHVTDVVMVARERIEGTNDVPSGAEVWSGIVKETTDVSSSHWGTSNVLRHDAGDGEAHVLLVTEVVSKNSCSILSKSLRSCTGND